ncbi:MAG: hypothetical protein ACE5JS_22365 [Nitrospinota bacterium]
MLTDNEKRHCDEILERDTKLRQLLSANELGDPVNPSSWYRYLSSIKGIQGNLHNSITFVATLLAKRYLMDRFDIASFDATAKPQGASGPDIDIHTTRGERIIGEIKTTVPLYIRHFGAQQEREILKDVNRLGQMTAEYKFMFVTEQSTFDLLKTPKYSSKILGVQLVELLSEREHVT